MDFSLQLDTKAFETALIQSAARLGRDWKEVYEEEADLLMRDIIKKTPPPVKGAGQKRTAGDIMFTAYAVHEKFLNILKQRFGRGPYNGRMRIKGNERIVAYARILNSVGELKAWHESRKHRITGHVSENYSNSLNNPQKALVSKGVMAAYIREAKRHVGAAKGGWATAQLSVAKGRALPSWISSHRQTGSVFKSFSIKLRDQQTFIASNASPWAKRTREAKALVQASLNNRARQIPVKTEAKIRAGFRQGGFEVRG